MRNTMTCFVTLYSMATPKHLPSYARMRMALEMTSRILVQRVFGPASQPDRGVVGG